MHFEGTFSVVAPREEVFDYLLNPKELLTCLPDVQKYEVKSQDEFTAVVRTGISFIKGDFSLSFKMLEKVRPSHAKLVARGSGIGSTVDLEANMDLTEENNTTSLKWQAEAKVGGRIASVGQRLISRQAEKIIEQLFGCVQKQVGGQG